jgi:hypothetical protein
MTHDEMIAVLTHHKNGGKVDVKLKENRNWTTCKDDPVWCFDCYDYRAKPEPQVIYADCNEQKPF